MTSSYHNVPNITVSKALEAVQNALSFAESIGIKASVSVVDRSMNLIAFAKADGATPHSTETSRRKANTAASTGKATGWMSPEISISLPLATDNKLTNVLGGVPLIFDGNLVGGLGIAGGTVEQDKKVVLEVLKNIGADAVNTS